MNHEIAQRPEQHTGNSTPSLLRSRCLGLSCNALPHPPTAASTRTTFLSIRVANHRVAHIILSQSRQNNSPNHSSRFIGYLSQTKIASLEKAFVSTASKYKMPRSWPCEKIVLLKKVSRLRSTVNLSKICSLKWKFEGSLCKPVNKWLTILSAISNKFFRRCRFYP